MSTFRETTPRLAILWRTEGLKENRASAAHARRTLAGLTRRTAWRSLIEVLAIAHEEAAAAFDAAWAREMAARPELTSGLDADVQPPAPAAEATGSSEGQRVTTPGWLNGNSGESAIESGPATTSAPATTNTQTVPPSTTTRQPRGSR